MERYINKHTGEVLNCTFAAASDLHPDRAVLEGLLTCLREEYGDTYIDRRVYDLDWLMAETRAGRLLTGVTFTEGGEPAGCLCLRENPPFAGVGDLCMHVVRKAYRGCGVGTPLVAWLMARPETARFSAIGSHNATFHILSQRESYACGLRPCGMLFSLYLSRGFVHSHANVGDKLSYAVAAMPLDRTPVRLCLPAHWRAFAEEYYASVHTPIQWVEEEAPAERSDLAVLPDETHCTLTLHLRRCGADLGERVSALLAEYGPRPMETVSLALALSDPAAAWGCGVLEALGFRFSGLQPFCRGEQYLLLHHPLSVPIPFDGMQIDSAYQPMFQAVRAAFSKEDHP